MSAEIRWLAVGAIAACAAAIVAAWQAWASRTATLRQAGFEQIRIVEERLRLVWHLSVRQARADALAFYRGTAQDLTPAAADYLAYLSALDLLLFACHEEAVDREIAMTWLRGALQRDDDTLQFIGELQLACGDPACFEYVKRHLGRAWQAALTIHPTRSRSGS